MLIKRRDTCRVVFLALLLTLLMHISFLTFFFVMKMNEKVSNNHKADVLFIDDPLQKKAMAWATTKTSGGGGGVSALLQPSALNNIPQQKDYKKEEEIKDNQAQKKAEPTIIDSFTQETNKLEKHQQTKKEELLKEDPIRQDREIKKVASDFVTSMLQSTTKEYKKDKEKKIEQKKEESKPESPPLPERSINKPLPSLSQIMNGFGRFMEETKHGVHGRVNVVGKDGSVPTDQQIKLERYWERVFASIYNCMHIAVRKNPQLMHLQSIKLYISFKRDGLIDKLHVTESSGLITIDTLMLEIVRDASNAFPPVPSYISLDMLAGEVVLTCKERR